MDHITPGQLTGVIAAASPAFLRWPIRDCSVCGISVDYVFEGGRIGVF